MESYLYAEIKGTMRNGGRVERIANRVADEMFAEIYAMHDAEKAKHRKHRKANRQEFRKESHHGKYYRKYDGMYGWSCTYVQECHHAEIKRERAKKVQDKYEYAYTKEVA